MRVAVVGLDGASWNLIFKLIDSGAMPFLSGSMSNSLAATLKSTIPPYTPVAWTSIFTGVNPGKHGIYCFHRVLKSDEGFKLELALSNHVAYPRINEMAALKGLKSIAVNLPLTYPPERMVLGNKGVIFTDWASPRIKVWPKEYGLRYRHLATIPPHVWSTHRLSDDEYLETVYKHLEGRAADIENMLTKEDWELFLIVLSEPDWLQHRFPGLQEGKGINRVLKIFYVIDKLIKFVREVSDVLLIVSDHGFKKYNYVVNINAILREKGLLRVRRGGLTPLERINRSHLRINSLNKLLMIGADVVSKLLGKKYSIDFTRSKAFMTENETWGVYCINNSVKEKVKEIISANPYIRRVCEKGEIYWGPLTAAAPDLICIPREDSWCSNGLDKPLTNNIADHHVDGIFIAMSDYLRDKKFLKRHVSVLDITPTVLTCLGLPIPHDCDGKPIKEVCGEAVGKTNYLFIYESIKRIKRIHA